MMQQGSTTCATRNTSLSERPTHCQARWNFLPPMAIALPRPAIPPNSSIMHSCHNIPLPFLDSPAPTRLRSSGRLHSPHLHPVAQATPAPLRVALAAPPPPHH